MYTGLAMESPGRLDLVAMVFMNAARGLAGTEIDSNSGYKKKDAWRLAQAVILFLAINLMRSGLSLVFF